MLSANPKTFLLVDDDVDDQQLFLEALRKVDHTIVCHYAINGEEAFDKLNRFSALPDLIFLDMNMPKISGKQCLSMLKKIEKFRNIPVVICSTSAFEKDIQEITALGAVYFLIKPSEFSILCNELSGLVSKIYPE